jgi:hypothetical protein
MANLPVANETQYGGDAQLTVAMWNAAADRLMTVQRGGPVRAAITAATSGRTPDAVVRLRLTSEQLGLVADAIEPIPG